MRYQVHPLTVWQSAYRANRGAIAKVSFRVVDTHSLPADCKGVRAWTHDEAVARQICDMLNGVNNHATYWQAQSETARTNALALEKRWQSVLDHTNGLLREAREAADILRNQLFEAREQRDEARAELAGAREGWGTDYTKISMAAVSRCLGVPMHEHVERLEAFKAARQNDAIGWTAEKVGKLIQERDELQAKLDKLLGDGSPADNEVLLTLARRINRVCFKS